MLGTRHSLPVSMAMRRATRTVYGPAVRSQTWRTTLATRPATVRTLSQRPGGQPASVTSPLRGGGGGGSDGGGEGGGPGFIGGTARVLVIAAALVATDMVLYAKVPFVKKFVDDKLLTGPLPPEVYDIYRRCGVEVSLPPGRFPPTREAWDMSYVKKRIEDIRRRLPFGSDKPGEKKRDGFEMGTSGFNKKGFSGTTHPSLDPSSHTESFRDLEETPESEPSEEEVDHSSAVAATAATAAIAATTDAAAVWKSLGPDGASSDGDDEASSGAATDSAARPESDEVFYAEEGELDAEAEAGEESEILEVVKPLVEMVESAAESLGYAAETAMGGMGLAGEEEQPKDSEAAVSTETAVERVGSAEGEEQWKGLEAAKAMESAAETAVEGVGSAEEEHRKDSEAAESTDSAIERKKQRIRNEALSGMTEETESASDGLKKELEHGMLQELRGMDEETLRFRVAQLSTELQERTKWEALRLMEGIKQKEADVARKYEGLLSEQKEMYEAETNKALREQEQELTTSVVNKYSEQLRHHLEQQAEDFKDALRANAMAGDEALRQELEAKHAEELLALKEEELKRSEDEIEELRHLSYKTERTLLELEAARKAEMEDKNESESVHRFTHAALALVETFGSSAPIKGQLDKLKALAPGDEVLEAAAGAIPLDAAAKGIPTLPQLKQRFGVVKSECRRAAMVPKEAGNGMFGHMLATMLVSVTFAPKGMVEGDGAEEVLARADHLLEAGELKSAVKEMEKLQGLPADVAQDWMRDAKVRVTADEVLRVIRSHASLLNAKHLRQA